MMLFFKNLFRQRSELVYIDDIPLMSTSKPYTLQLIEHLHDFANKENLKLAPEKFFSILLTVRYLGHETGFNTIKLFPSKITAIHEIPSPTTKNELMRFMNFYFVFFIKLKLI